MSDEYDVVFSDGSHLDARLFQRQFLSDTPFTVTPQVFYESLDNFDHFSLQLLLQAVAPAVDPDEIEVNAEVCNEAGDDPTVLTDWSPINDELFRTGAQAPLNNLTHGTGGSINLTYFADEAVSARWVRFTFTRVATNTDRVNVTGNWKKWW